LRDATHHATGMGIGGTATDEDRGHLSVLAVPGALAAVAGVCGSGEAADWGVRTGSVAERSLGAGCD
jgi:hypothetical protein